MNYSHTAAHYARMRRIAAQATGRPIPAHINALLAPHWLYGYNTGCTDQAAREIFIGGLEYSPPAPALPAPSPTFPRKRS